jgi:hypothetical protein
VHAATVTPTASPAGAVRERSIACTWCGTSTWNHEATCDGCLDRRNTALRPCRSCARPIAKPARWCSDACRLEDEGPLDDRLDVGALR